MKKMRVLVVDDSSLARRLLTGLVNSQPDMEVVFAASSAIEAQRAIDQLAPDVVTLDVEMPGMNGLELLEHIMRTAPRSVLMVSNLTEEGSVAALRAMELGAVDCIAKQGLVPAAVPGEYAEEIFDKLRAASNARLDLGHYHRPVAPSSIPAPRTLDRSVLRENLIFVGASTGGTEAIREVLSALPEHVPGILMVQHMPEMFTASFARRLDHLCKIRVKEAEQGEPVQAGTAYLAPGHSHLQVKRINGVYRCELSRAEPVNRHRPSVDVLFHSAASELGAKALGVLLTGMGKDGARGMLAMKQQGAYNLAQDELSSVVWGMPREAAALGAVQEVLPLKDIAPRLLQQLRLAEGGSVRV